MQPRDFVFFWLQGFFEISGCDFLTEPQVQIIKDHLALVFKKETPDRSMDLQHDEPQYFSAILQQAGEPNKNGDVFLPDGISREEVFELGSKTTYYKPAEFPIEITAEMEKIYEDCNAVQGFDDVPDYTGLKNPRVVYEGEALDFDQIDEHVLSSGLTREEEAIYNQTMRGGTLYDRP